MVLLHQRDTDSLLVEGGARTLAGFLEASLADEVYTFVAPKILGDSEALPPLPGSHATGAMSDAFCLKSVTVRQIGEDALIHGYLTEL